MTAAKDVVNADRNFPKHQDLVEERLVVVDRKPLAVQLPNRHEVLLALQRPLVHLLLARLPQVQLLQVLVHAGHVGEVVNAVRRKALAQPLPLRLALLVQRFGLRGRFLADLHSRFIPLHSSPLVGPQSFERGRTLSLGHSVLLGAPNPRSGCSNILVISNAGIWIPL